MKNPIVTRDIKAKPKAVKDNFLSEAQRHELRKKLIDKYVKTVGLCNPQIVVDEVDRFFATNDQINQKTLMDLESKIKKAVLQYKSNAVVKKEPSEQALYAQNPQQVKIVDESQDQPQCEKVPNKNLPRALTDLENDQDWDNIGLYQAYILKQEKELEKKRKALEQKAIRAQLDNQVKEKEQKNGEIGTEHQSYVEMEKEQYDRFQKHQEEIRQQKEKEKKGIFDMQTKMIEARNIQLEKEKKIQDEIDKKIMQSIETDLAKQRELQVLRAEQKKKEMVVIREENEHRKQRKLEQESKERAEEIELQKLTNELAQDLDNQRAEEIKRKAEKIQKMMIVGDSVVKNQRQKNLNEEKKLCDFVEKKNKLIELKEKKIQVKEKENKLKYREILDLQIKEREDKLKAEREYIREQASLWKQEEEYYNNFNEIKSKTQKNNVDEYKKMLEIQIREKDDKMKKLKKMELPSEEHIKNLLLEQIQNLEIQNQILGKQLSE